MDAIPPSVYGSNLANGENPGRASSFNGPTWRESRLANQSVAEPHRLKGGQLNILVGSSTLYRENYTAYRSKITFYTYILNFEHT